MMKQAARSSMLLLIPLICVLVITPRDFYAQTKSEKIDALISNSDANGIAMLKKLMAMSFETGEKSKRVLCRPVKIPK